MDTVTYPNDRVIAEMDRHFVPVRLESAKHGELARRLNVRWLPGLVVADADGRPAHVSIGFLPPDDVLVEMTFGRAINAMAAKRYDEAHALFQDVAGDPARERAPEALFWWGISRYRQLKDFSTAVREPWGRIAEGWPRSQWARKVGFALGKPTLGS
jgi:TolA-binding protein